jgi:diadenosine tetraphosphate (Ap4A) HIT family hydrolase
MSGWVVLGDTQFLPGYSLLLADPVVESINDLAVADRQVFLTEMTILGDALLQLTEAYRINYEILGNTDAALHAHVFPRYRHEPDGYREMPVWLYDRESRNNRPFDLERDKPFIAVLRQKLTDAGICVE